MTHHIDDLPETSADTLTPPSRRDLLRGAGTLGIAAAAGMYLSGCGGSNNNGTGNSSGGGTVITTPTPNPTPGTVFTIDRATDVDILNYALNLEYLEAEFYLRAVTGQGLSNADITGTGTQGDVTGGRQVTFTSGGVLQQFFQELANDELAHVRFLRTALGNAAVARPQINFTDAFNAAARAAGIANTFDPFANETNFLLGSFVFEDVGVTAYKGGGRYIKNKAYLENAAGILAVEAFHAGAVRSLIYDAGTTAINIATRIATLRLQAGGNEEAFAGTITSSDGINFVPSDAQGRVFSRTPAQVHRVVYLTATGATSGGGFFPAGTNSVFSYVA